jgi:uncharacterized membrane protein YeaQ/YmgE (transglycosylase-associated protein family)
MSIIAWIVLGLVAGWLAGLVMRGGGYGIVGDIVLGILGALIGGWITGMVSGQDVTLGFNLPSLLIAVLGAIVLIGLSRLVTRRTATGGPV